MGSEDFEDATREFDRVRDKAGAAVMNGDEAVLRHAQGIDISTWSHIRLDRELNRLADAYGLMEQERDGN